MFLVEQAHWYFEVRGAHETQQGLEQQLVCCCSQLTPHPGVWFLLLQDYVRDQDTSLRSLGLKEFAALVFQNCPELSQHAVRNCLC
jgi:hypothetical protein